MQKYFVPPTLLCSLLNVFFREIALKEETISGEWAWRSYWLWWFWTKQPSNDMIDADLDYHEPLSSNNIWPTFAFHPEWWSLLWGRYWSMGGSQAHLAAPGTWKTPSPAGIKHSHILLSTSWMAYGSLYGLLRFQCWWGWERYCWCCQTVRVGMWLVGMTGLRPVY